jgi:hypothetical protein
MLTTYGDFSGELKPGSTLPSSIRTPRHRRKRAEEAQAIALETSGADGAFLEAAMGLPEIGIGGSEWGGSCLDI